MSPALQRITAFDQFALQRGGGEPQTCLLPPTDLSATSTEYC